MNKGKMDGFFYSFVALVSISALQTANAAARCPGLRYLDLVFAVDTSHSINEADFNLMRKFTAGLVGLLSEEVDLDVAVISFSGRAKVHMSLNGKEKKKGAKAMKETILKLKQPKDNWDTNTHLGLFLARNQLQSVTYGKNDRCHVQKAMVLITDGYPTEEDSAVKEANKVREAGIHLFVVGTGQDWSGNKSLVKQALAYCFTSNDKSKVFRVEDYKKLEGVADKIVRDMCTDVRSHKKPAQLREVTEKSYEAINKILK